MTLEEVWKDAQTLAQFNNWRTEFQEQVNRWCSKDHKRHLPIYLSHKPKISLWGLYFEKTRGKGAIVLFPIRARSFPITEVTIASKQQMLDTLKHEYAHHLTGTAHGKKFQDNLLKASKRR